MKKISLLFVLSILSIQLSTAQNQQTEPDPKKEELTSNKAGGNQWIFGLGFNTVNNSGAEFKDLSNSDHWAFGKIPFYGSVATQFTDKWAAKATLSFNYFKDGKVMNGETILGQSEGGNDAGYLATTNAITRYFEVNYTIIKILLLPNNLLYTSLSLVQVTPIQSLFLSKLEAPNVQS